jgi:hypothetical protein
MPALVVDTSSAGDATLVAAPTSKVFTRVIGVDLSAASAVTVTLKHGSTAIWTKTINAGQAPTGPTAELTLDCAPGTALVINLSGAVAVKGVVQYIQLGAPPV